MVNSGGSFQPTTGFQKMAGPWCLGQEGEVQEGILREPRHPASGAPSPPRSPAAVSKAAGRGQCTLPFPKVPGVPTQLPGKNTRWLRPQLLRTAQL